MLTNQELAYIDEQLDELEIDTGDRPDIYVAIADLWNDSESWWFKESLDPFIWLPVLAFLCAKSLGYHSIHKTSYIIPRNIKDIKTLDNEATLLLPKLANPLEKSLFAAISNNISTDLDQVVLNRICGELNKYSSLLYNGLYITYKKSFLDKFPTSVFHFFATVLRSLNQGFFLVFVLNAYPLLDKRLEDQKRIEEEEQSRLQAEAEAKRQAAEEATKLASLLQGHTLRNGWEPLDESMLFDAKIGHWALWGQESVLKGRKAFGRDPARDIQAHVPVAIDFGTSSTVVATRQNGKPHLLRVGHRNWTEAAEARDFENPTCLEFIDTVQLAEDWQKGFFMPPISWAALKCAHQAADDISPVAPAQQLNSILADLKTWSHQGQNLEMADQQNNPFWLAPLSEASGEGLDPLELYAFHLGLALNNQYRANGQIYHEYYLSFPATFKSSVRQKILASFKSGLERSLPENLGKRKDWRKTYPFTVTEGADEPVAYAAAALEVLDLAPEAGPVQFGVFDFGGGTTDFAFGQYRQATEEENKAQGWEYVIDLIDATGLEDLGGEKLLGLLAHELVCANLPELARHKIPVAPQPGAVQSAGSERIFGDGILARANRTRLMEALRPLWEDGPGALDVQNENILRISLQSLTLADGKPEEITATLALEKLALQKILQERIAAGVKAFFTGFRQAFKFNSIAATEFHILLAGNSCRSPLVAGCFKNEISRIAENYNVNPERFILHKLLLPDDANPEGLTLKTGVALGQLKTVPGESLGVNRILPEADEAFKYAFGHFRKGILKPVLNHYTAHGKWVEFGRVAESLRLIIAWSDSPLVIEEDICRGDPSLHEKVEIFDASEKGRIIFARITGQTGIELATADSREEIDEKNVRKISLGAC